MPYRVELLPSSVKELRSLPQRFRNQVARRISALESDPRPPGVAPVEGRPGLLRIRSGDYRILYRVDDTELLVTVASIGHRREIYRDLREPETEEARR